MRLNLFKKGAAAGPVICKRPDGTVYAVLSPARWRELRGDTSTATRSGASAKRGDCKRLNEFLKSQRDSGIIIDMAED